jgi:hypothetical protein
MIRSIAKFLIQYFHDSNSVSSNSDQLPHWLRRWVHSDPMLSEYEQELVRLESTLVSQANKHIAERLESKTELASVCRNTSFSSRSVLRSPVALAALAASLVCVILVGRWLIFNSNGREARPDVASLAGGNAQEQNAKSKSREQWIRSTMSATKRLALKLNEKGTEATGSIAIANRTLNQETELLKVAGLEGLRFVTQKLPAATVRMVGLNDPNRN